MNENGKAQKFGAQNSVQGHSDREAALRKQLGVAETASVRDILGLIVETGCVPRPMSTVLKGEQLFACPVSRGIFSTVQADEYGQLGQAGSPTEMLAVLEALQRARDMA